MVLVFEARVLLLLTVLVKAGTRVAAFLALVLMLLLVQAFF